MPSDAGLRGSATELTAFIEKIEAQEWTAGKKMSVDVFVPGQEIEAPKEGHVQVITAMPKGDVMSDEDEAWLAGLYHANVPNLWVGCEDVLDKIDSERPTEAPKPEVDPQGTDLEDGEGTAAEGPQLLEAMKGKKFDLKGGEVFELSTPQGNVKIEHGAVTLNQVRYKVGIKSPVEGDIKFDSIEFDSDGRFKFTLGAEKEVPLIGMSRIKTKKLKGDLEKFESTLKLFLDSSASSEDAFSTMIQNQTLYFSAA